VARETLRDAVPALLGDQLQQLALVKPAHRQPLNSLAVVRCQRIAGVFAAGDGAKSVQ